MENLDAAIADSDGLGLLRLASATGHDTRSTYEEFQVHGHSQACWTEPDRLSWAHGAGRRGCCSPLTTLGTSSISRIV